MTGLRLLTLSLCVLAFLMMMLTTTATASPLRELVERAVLEHRVKRADNRNNNCDIYKKMGRDPPRSCKNSDSWSK